MQIKTNELGYCVHIAPTCIYTSYIYDVVTCIYQSIYLLKCVRCAPFTGTFHFKFLWHVPFQWQRFSNNESNTTVAMHSFDMIDGIYINIEGYAICLNTGPTPT